MLFRIQPQRLPLCICFRNVLRQLQQLLDHLLVGEHSVAVPIHSTLNGLGELLRLDQVRPAIDGNLLRNQLLQKFHRKVFLLHVGDFFQKFRVKKRKLCSDIREKINYTFAFDALLQKFVDPLIHFRKGKFLACSTGLQPNNHRSDCIKKRRLIA